LNCPSSFMCTNCIYSVGAPPLYVSKWVDFREKYGIGYYLSNGSYGVLFNDLSRIVLDVSGEFFEYQERCREGLTSSRRTINTSQQDTELQRYTIDEYPLILRKKVILMEQFLRYLRNSSDTPVSEIKDAEIMHHRDQNRNMETVSKFLATPNLGENLVFFMKSDLSPFH
jgi:hypothetical protein